MTIGTQWNVEDIDALVTACKTAIRQAPEMTRELEQMQRALVPFMTNTDRVFEFHTAGESSQSRFD